MINLDVSIRDLQYLLKLMKNSLKMNYLFLIDKSKIPYFKKLKDIL